MDTLWKQALWQQFGAAIDFLATTVDTCPDALWEEPLWDAEGRAPEFVQFWYVTYHTLFWLDLYLTGTETGFKPTEPFTLIELQADGPVPERVYTRAELRAYLDDCRQQCRETILALTDETAQRTCTFGWGTCSFLELLLYNMRHVHGHAAQLNMLLGQHSVQVQDWVAQADNP